MQCDPRPATDSDLRLARRLQLLGLSFGHALNDGYVNFIAPLWPQVKATFGLSNADVGLITLYWGITTNFGQPVLGYLTDRWRPKRLVVAATLISTVFFSFIGYARSFPLFMACLIVGGVGVATYHPRGGALAASVSGSRRALGMGIFSAGGAVGFAVGYLCSPYLYGLTGSMTGLAYAAPVGLVGALILLFIDAEGRVAADRPALSLRRHVLPHLRPIMPLLAVMILRSAAVVAVANFVPIMLAERGRALVAGGHAGFYFVAGGAIGGLVGGHISDRIGRRGITILSLLLSPPFLMCALRAAALPSLGRFFLALFAAGFILRGAEPVNITHTQELLPRGASLAASLGMGGAWGVAGLVAPLVGKVADTWGVEYALGWVAWIPLLAGLAAILIPRGATHRDG
jgi:FSR family fosmidomycin resistance protein-like MFS transporter